VHFLRIQVFLVMLSNSVTDVWCYDGGAFFKPSQISYDPAQCTAFMYQGQGVFKYNPSKYEESIQMLLNVAVRKTWVLNALAVPTANLPLASCLQHHFFYFWFVLSACWFTVQVCLLLVILLPSVTLELPRTCYSCHVKACLLWYWLHNNLML